MLTPDQIRQALSARGISLPDFEIDSLYCLVGSISACVDGNYTDDCVKNAILLWSAVLIGSSVGGRYVKIQGAPSGASQSFDYGSRPWVSLYNQLNNIDSAGCSRAIVEPPPDIKGAFFGVMDGSCGGSA